MRGDIPEVPAGELPKRDDYNRLVRRANREIVGQNFYEDEDSIVIMEEPWTDGIVYFELTETLDADSTTGATAYRRTFDSSANAGEGGYTTGTDEITVKDTREVGYEGSSGAKGACIMKSADNGPFGEIIDMECP